MIANRNRTDGQARNSGTMCDPPAPGDWRKELDERETVTVAFAQRYRQSWGTVPVAGRHMILMIADLTTRLSTALRKSIPNSKCLKPAQNRLFRAKSV
jgi:hypothetical protein